MSKKEKVLYMNHGRKWDVIVKYLITYSSQDGMNIIKCSEIACYKKSVILKRITRKYKFLKCNIYFNKLYLGLDEWN